MSTTRLEDIHNASLEARARDHMARESQALSARIEEFVDSNCPACNSAQRELAFQVHGFQHQRCLSCRTLYISPCPTEEHVLKFLKTSEGLRIWREEMSEDTRASRRPMYQKRLKATLEIARRYGIKTDLVLEVGGGSGEFAQEVVVEGSIEKLIIAEPQPLDLHLPGVEVVAGSFEQIDLNAEADMVLAFEVFEHIIEPERFLAMVRRCLRPGGILYMSTPNGDSYEIAVLGERSYTIPF